MFGSERVVPCGMVGDPIEDDFKSKLMRSIDEGAKLLLGAEIGIDNAIVFDRVGTPSCGNTSNFSSFCSSINLLVVSGSYLRARSKSSFARSFLASILFRIARISQRELK